MAARAGQVEVVRCLLRNGAIVDARARVRPPFCYQQRHTSSTSPAFCSVFLMKARCSALSAGGPDSPPHRLASGQNGDCAAAAAAHGSSRRCHHQRLHPPAHLCQGGAGGDGVGSPGGRSFTLTCHEGGLSAVLFFFFFFNL